MRILTASILFLVAATPLFAESTYQVETSWNTSGDIGGMAVVGVDSFIVSDIDGGSVVPWTNGVAGSAVSTWTNPGEPTDSFSFVPGFATGPRGVCLDDSGRVLTFSLDTDHNLLVWNSDLSPTQWRLMAAEGLGGPGHLFEAAVDAAGNVYTLFYYGVPAGRSRLEVYGPVTGWGASHLETPISVTDHDPSGTVFHQGLAVTDDGSAVFISDRASRRVVRMTGSPASGYSPDAGFSLDLIDSGSSSLGFKGMALASGEQWLLIADDGADQVVIADAQTGAQSPLSFSAPGDPISVGIDSEGSLCVAHSASRRVDKFTLQEEEPPPPGDNELRGVWISRFEWPSTSPSTAQSRINSVFTNAANNNFNAVFFQMRGQCDTLYPSPNEPWSPLIGGSDPGWDPLQYAVNAAHSRGVEIHAYINTHTCWQSSSAPSYAPDHVFWDHCNVDDPAHQDWLIHDDSGIPQGYSEYVWMNPGVPAMDAWVREQIMYVIDTYDIDGVHFDRVRMAERNWGRAPIAVARHDNPATAEPNDGQGNPEQLDFDDFMRDSVTRALINIRGQAWSRDSSVAVSATPVGLWRADAYPCYSTGYFYGYWLAQDGKAWMNAGAVDFLVPQIYWGDGGALPDFSDIYPDWQTAADTAGRFLTPGSSNSNGQLEVENHALIVRAGGGEGHVTWSHGSTDYASWSSAGHPYESAATVPTFPWLTAEGIIFGHVYESDGITPVTDAWVNRTGDTWTALSSEDGFHCFLRLAPGVYSLTAEHPDHGTAEVIGVNVNGGDAVEVDLVLGSSSAPTPVGLISR
jgi:uncharacterized lipoprotein YddW (UPF0748 family)